MREAPNTINIMTALDNNAFIQNSYCFLDEFYINFYIYYVDHSKRDAAFTKESTEKEVMLQLLHLIDRDLKDKGWDTQHDDSPKEYNPADDPYYQNEDLYIPNEINCGNQ